MLAPLASPSAAMYILQTGWAVKNKKSCAIEYCIPTLLHSPLPPVCTLCLFMHLQVPGLQGMHNWDAGTHAACPTAGAV